jgi:transcriptional regulator with XRE-family HTH domain
MTTKKKTATTTKESFGARLKAARRAVGLTQGSLARRLNVTVYAVVRWERGDREPRLAMLRRLAAELKTTIGALTE